MAENKMGNEMKREFIRNGVKITLEVVDWNAFNKIVKKCRDLDNEYGDWSDAIYVKKQLEDQYNNCVDEYTKQEPEVPFEELLAAEVYCKQLLDEWDKNKSQNDWKSYFEQEAELADEEETMI